MHDWTATFEELFKRSGLSLEEAEAELGVSARQIRRYIANEVAPTKLVMERIREIAGKRSTKRAEPAFRFIKRDLPQELCRAREPCHGRGHQAIWCRSLKDP